MKKQSINRLIDTENKLRAARWKGVEELGGKVKGLRSTVGSYRIATGI